MVMYIFNLVSDIHKLQGLSALKWCQVEDSLEFVVSYGYCNLLDNFTKRIKSSWKARVGTNPLAQISACCTFNAIRNHQLPMLKKLLQQPKLFPLNTNEVHSAVKFKCEPILDHLLENHISCQPASIYSAVVIAAANGSLPLLIKLNEYIKKFFENKEQLAVNNKKSIFGFGKSKKGSADYNYPNDQYFIKATRKAAFYGHLAVIQWMYQNREDKLRGSRAMDCAAEGGHIEILKWMHKNTREFCSQYGLKDAARHGYLETIKWIHDTYKDMHISTDVMRVACLYGHLEVVKWIHHNRSEGANSQALSGAAQSGHLDIVKFLCTNRTEGNIQEALQTAINVGRQDVAEYLERFQASKLSNHNPTS